MSTLHPQRTGRSAVNRQEVRQTLIKEAASSGALQKEFVFKKHVSSTAPISDDGRILLLISAAVACTVGLALGEAAHPLIGIVVAGVGLYLVFGKYFSLRALLIKASQHSWAEDTRTLWESILLSPLSAEDLDKVLTRAEEDSFLTPETASHSYVRNLQTAVETNGTFKNNHRELL